jgi:site-specific DNA-methyltransferase (adenine-specific)
MKGLIEMGWFGELGDDMDLSNPNLPKPYYSENGIVIYHADCREILPLLPKVDLVLTDPPYESEAHTMQRRVKRGGGVMECEPLTFAPIDTATRLLVANQLAHLAKRWVLTFCQVEAAPLWRADYELAGLKYRRTCIWVKPDGMPQYSGDRPGMGYETFVAMHKEGKSVWNGGGRHGVFIFNKNDNGGNPNEHPTTKPLKLVKELVELFSNPGDTVLDCFSGSGTTLRAAKDLGRKAIGIEIELKYVEIAIKRLQQQVLPLELEPVEKRERDVQPSMLTGMTPITDGE